MQEIYTSHQLSSLVSYVIRTPLLHWKFWGLFLAHGDWDMFTAGDLIHLIQGKHMMKASKVVPDASHRKLESIGFICVDVYHVEKSCDLRSTGVTGTISRTGSITWSASQATLHQYDFVNICEQSLCVWQYQAHSAGTQPLLSNQLSYSCSTIKSWPLAQHSGKKRYLCHYFTLAKVRKRAPQASDHWQRQRPYRWCWLCSHQIGLQSNIIRQSKAGLQSNDFLWILHARILLKFS